jgi:heptosyltransferase-2
VISNDRAHPRVILAVLPNWLGDVVMSLPALDELRDHGTLVAVGRSAFLDLLADDGRIDAAVPHDRGGRWGLSSTWKAARRCGRHRPDLAVVFTPSARGAALAAAAGAPRRRGLTTGVPRLLLNEVRRPRGAPRSQHLADTWLALAREASDAASGSAVPRYRAGARGRAGLTRLRERLELPSARAFVTLAPGAIYGPTKRWPQEHFVELADRLRQTRGWTSVIVGGSHPQEQELADGIAGRCGGVSTAGATDLPTLAALLSESAAFVGNDSGAMHLAAAVGIPCVGIFGSTSPMWTGPRGAAATSCGPHPVDCAPCFRRSCPIGLPCLRDLAPRLVVAELETLLQTPRPASRKDAEAQP